MASVLYGKEFFKLKNNDLLSLMITFDENRDIVFFEMLTYDYYILFDKYENNSYETTSLNHFENVVMKKEIDKHPIQNLDLEIGKAMEFVNLYLSK